MTSTAESSTKPVLPSTERWVLISTILASAMAFIDSSALNVALPAIQGSLHASGAQLLWVINAYLLMLASLILIGGSLGDKLGRKKIFAAGITIFMIGSLACGLAPSINFMIAMRVLQGLGGVLMIPGSLAIINATIPAGHRGQAIGTWSSATTVVTIAGPILGGLLAGAGLWRWVFLINIPLGILALLLVIGRVPETRNEQAGAIDIPGTVLTALALAGLTYGFIAAPGSGFGNPQVYLPLAVGVIALVLFILVEWRSSHPMMPLHLFRSRVFSGTNLLTLFLYGALSATSFFLSLNLIQAQGYSASQAGLAFTPFAILLALLSRRVGRWADQYGPRLPLILGPFLVGVGFLLLSLPGLTSGPRAYWTTFFPGILVFGVGMGFTVAPLTTTVLSAVSRDFSGTASGINNAVSRTAGVLAIAILGAVALFQFQSQLMNHLAGLDLPAPAMQTLRANASQLGALQPPGNLSLPQQQAVKQTVAHAFVDTYATLTLINTALAWLSATMAFAFIRNKKPGE